MLTGSELLAKVKDLGDVSKTDLATACGYVSDKKDGGQRVNFTAFYEALLNAKALIWELARRALVKVVASFLMWQPFRAMATC